MYALRAAARRAPCLPRASNGARLRIHATRYYSVVVDAPVPRKSKVWDNIDDAIKDVKSGDILLSGGALKRAQMPLQTADMFSVQALDYLASQKHSSPRSQNAQT